MYKIYSCISCFVLKNVMFVFQLNYKKWCLILRTLSIYARVCMWDIKNRNECDEAAVSRGVTCNSGGSLWMLYRLHDSIVWNYMDCNIEIRTGTWSHFFPPRAYTRDMDMSWQQAIMKRWGSRGCNGPPGVLVNEGCEFIWQPWRHNRLHHHFVVWEMVVVGRLQSRC